MVKKAIFPECVYLLVREFVRGPVSLVLSKKVCFKKSSFLTALLKNVKYFCHLGPFGVSITLRVKHVP